MKAYCTNTKCNYIFTPNLVAAANSTVIIKNVTYSCPRCGNQARIPDGNYKYDEKGIATYLASGQFSIEALTEFKQFIKTAIKEEFNQQRIINEAVKIDPGFGAILNYAPKNFADLIGFLTLVAAIVQIVISQMTTNPNQPQVINNYYYSSSEFKEQIAKEIKTNQTIRKVGAGSNYTPPKKKRKKK